MDESASPPLKTAKGFFMPLSRSFVANRQIPTPSQGSPPTRRDVFRRLKDGTESGQPNARRGFTISAD
jgi:hypothetical protein